MPLQNRVLPTGEIAAIPDRGTLTGNRGIIHREGRVLGTARWSHHAWICCTLDWQGRRRQVMTGRKWTELFFLDEAVALAAGHRPCGYCRRPAYDAFVTAWTRATGTRPSAKEMDRALHAARVGRNRRQMTYSERVAALPAGAMWRNGGQIFLGTDRGSHTYGPGGYGPPIVPDPETIVSVLTPRPIVAVLQAGYRPALHPSAVGANS